MAIYISIHARQCLKLCIYTTQALIPASALHAPPTKSIRNNRMIDSNNFQRLPGKGIPSHPATPTRKVKAITHSLWRTGTKRQATDADVLSNKRATRASCTPSPPPPPTVPPPLFDHQEPAALARAPPSPRLIALDQGGGKLRVIRPAAEI